MAHMKIRQADNRDCESIVHFVWVTLQDMVFVGGHEVNPDETFWREYGEKVIKAIKNGDRLYLFAETENGIVGYLEGKQVTLQEVFKPKKSFHISAVYVLPDERRKGIATALFREALRWGLEQGCQEADLNVLVNNSDAKWLYEKLGFKVFQHEMRMKLNQI